MPREQCVPNAAVTHHPSEVDGDLAHLDGVDRVADMGYGFTSIAHAELQFQSPQANTGLGYSSEHSCRDADGAVEFAARQRGGGSPHKGREMLHGAPRNVDWQLGSRRARTRITERIPTSGCVLSTFGGIGDTQDGGILISVPTPLAHAAVSRLTAQCSRRPFGRQLPAQWLFPYTAGGLVRALSPGVHFCTTRGGQTAGSRPDMGGGVRVDVVGYLRWDGAEPL
ncbi:hypothetical protein Purlil1_6692 [Purpureocillium lilacinum]|uniref:Uncharacterized protein n=1 Tax=Purpureocillium lilacinum TaxID=33203 RepID=A0ABR0BXR3_PURLI|nr:hypothetical protein Purlil1_6692 [Purpureocillium lilacinum]